MLNEGDKWDPATVLGLSNCDRVLVIGNPAFLPWLTLLFQERPHLISSARKPSEIERLLRDGERFTHIILARETSYSHDHLLRAGAFRAKLVCFPSDDGWSVEQSAEFYYPDCPVWKFDSTFGNIIMAEPRGASWRFYAE